VTIPRANVPLMLTDTRCFFFGETVGAPLKRDGTRAETRFCLFVETDESI